MEKVKISSLGILDEQKFKKIASERDEWLNSGDDMLISDSYRVNELASEISPENVVVVLSGVIQENKNYKTLILSSKDGESLPIFKAGQRISITLNINNNYYTKPYTIISSPNSSIRGEYRIAVRNNEETKVDDYLYNKVKIGEKITVSSPFGDFYYSSIRDKNHVIAIASGEGIMPFYSMIQDIIENKQRFDLTLFYSAKCEEDLLYKDELIECSEKSTDIKVNFVLIEEEKKDYQHGYVTLKMIQDAFVEGDTSIFISGPEGLLKYLNKELEKMKLPKKYVVYDNFLPLCNIKKVEKYTLVVYINDEKYEVPCYNNKTIMYALMNGGIYIPSKCHNGSCGYCRSELLLGEVKVVNDKRNAADKKYNFIHPCSTYPLSDIEIIVR